MYNISLLIFADNLTLYILRLNQLKIPATESKSYNSSRSRSPQRVTSSIPASSNVRVEVRIIIATRIQMR